MALPANEEDTINAGGGKDTINALGGNDFINGGADADTIFGGTGNDTYVVDHSGDIVNETGGNGLDTVQSSITFSLSDAVHMFPSEYGEAGLLAGAVFVSAPTTQASPQSTLLASTTSES